MDPNTGKVYPSRQAALDAGVEHPVEIIGRPRDVRRISTAVQDRMAMQDKAVDARRARNRQARASRKTNRNR